MATYKQELAEWEAKRKEAWNDMFDKFVDEQHTYSDAEELADDEIEAWERRYPAPRPERKLVQKSEKVEPPSRIGCQDLTYTREGVRLSNNYLCPLWGLKNLLNGIKLYPRVSTFHGVCGYNGTYHDGYIVISGQRVTTAQLAAMIERCEELATKPSKKQYQIWYMNCGKPHESYNVHPAWGYITGGLPSRKDAEDLIIKWGYAPNGKQYEIREVEVYE